MNARGVILLPVLGIGLLLSVTPAAQAPATPAGVDLVKATYTKYEYLAPMRDGVRLFTSIYVPKDTAQKYPFLITRTPYSVAPYGVDQYRASLGPSDRAARSRHGRRRPREGEPPRFDDRHGRRFRREVDRRLSR
jgi:predicted acyl esterase